MPVNSNEIANLKNLIPYDGDIYYLENFLNFQEAYQYFQKLYRDNT